MVVENGMITISGGKWTTYRKMAQDTIDTAIKIGNLKPERNCCTENFIVLGSEKYTLVTFTEVFIHKNFFQILI